VIVVPHVENYLSKISGHKITLGNIYFSPLKRGFSVTDAVVDERMRFQKTTVYLSLFKIITNLSNPAEYIKNIEISGAEIDLTANQAKPPEELSSKNEDLQIKLPFLQLDVNIDNIKLKYADSDFEFADCLISFFGEKIFASAAAEIYKNQFLVNMKVLQKDDGVFAFDCVISSSDSYSCLIDVNGTFDHLSRNFSQFADVKNFSYGKYDISGSSWSVIKNAEGISSVLEGKFGKITLNSEDMKALKVAADLDLSKINPQLKGTLQTDAVYSGLLDVSAAINNLEFLGFKLGNFDINAQRDKQGRFDIVCFYDEEKKNSLTASIQKNGNYKGILQFSGKTAGSVEGNFNTGEIKLNLNKSNVSQMPFAAIAGENPKGVIEAKGSIDDYSGKIKIFIKGVNTEKIGKTDIYGLIARQGSMYVFNFYKGDNSIIFNTVVEEGVVLSADFKFVSVNTANILKLFGYSDKGLSGTAGGRIIYEKDGIMDFDIKAYDGTIGANAYSKFEIKGDFNAQRVNIKNVIFKGSGKTSAYAYGLIGFSETTPQSYFNLKMRDIDCGGVLLNGDLAFNGSLSDKEEVSGKFESGNIRISEVPFKNFNASALITRDKIEITDIKSDNGLDGSVFVNYSDKKLLGALNFKNTNIKNLFSGISGLLNASLKFSGDSAGFAMNADISLKKGDYLKIPFSMSSKLSYAKGILNIDGAQFVSGKTGILINGKYYDKGTLGVSVKNFNETIINKLVGFRTPVKGKFEGSGTVSFKNGFPVAKMAVVGSDVFVKNVKLNGFKSGIEISGGKISINGASAKIADSEIRADGGNFNLKNGKYDLNLFLVNAHPGPSDMFGRILLSGVMDKKKGGSVYGGKMAISNFWINRYKILSHEINYVIKDKKLSIFQDDTSASSLKIAGLIDFSQGISVKDFLISKNASSLSLNASFEGDKIDLSASATALDWVFLTEMLDLPVDMEGTMSLKAVCFGTLLKPTAKLSVNSLNGTIMGIPYDDIDVEISASDNQAVVKNAEIRKKNEIRVSVKGYFPFWLDSSLSKPMKKKGVDINYEIEDNKLNFLKYLSGEFFKPRSGKFTVKGRVSGTPEKINNNGELTVSGGSFDSLSYLGRIKDLNVSVSVNDNNVKINKFSAKSGAGRFNASGGLSLNNFQIADINLRIFSDDKGVPVQVPDLPISSFILSKNMLKDVSTGEPKFDITVSGTPSKPKIAGRVILENTRFSFPPPDDDDSDFPLPDDTEFDIELLTGKNTKYENSFINAWINGKLNIKGKSGSIKAPGVIDTQRGNINYLGINFDIISAKLEVTENNLVFLSGEAETVVYSKVDSQADTIRMVIDKSEIGALNARFYSKDDPTMDSQTALAKATRTEQDAGAQSAPLISFTDFALRQQALRLIDSNIATPLARTVLRKTGLVDNFKVTYVPVSEQSATTDIENSSFESLLFGTKYSVEKNLTNQILLGYSITFDQVNNKLDLRHAIEMKYKLSNNLYLSGSYELESETSQHQPDRKLMLQHQFRFGLPRNKQNKDEKN
jgi:hypothetical protein